MSNKLLKNTVIVLGCSVAVKLLSFVWEAILAACFGVSDQADAFYMTTSIFNILYPILDLSIWKVFLPLYKTKMVQDENKNLHKLANIALSFFFAISVALVLFLIVFAEPITFLTAPGFDPSKKALTMQYLRWSAPMYLLMSSASVIGAMLQCHDRFFGSQIRELGTHISKIIFVLLCYHYLGIYAAVIAMIIGSIFRVLVQLPFINWKWRFRPDFHFRDPDIRQMIRGLPSVALTAAINHVNGLVDKIIASGAVSGAVACLNYGHRLMNVFSGMISTAIGTATYPMMVQHIAEKKPDKLRELLTNIIGVLSFFIVPISLFCIFFSQELVSIAFQRGAFDAAAANLTAGIFAGYSFGMLFIGISTIITNVFYGYGDTRITLMISILDIVLNIVLNIWFCRMWDVVGLAVATSVSATICFAVRLFFMRKYLMLDYKQISVEFIKILIISIVSVFGIFVLLEWIGVVNIYIRVLAGLLFSVPLYILFAKLFRISTIGFAISLIRKKTKK